MHAFPPSHDCAAMDTAYDELFAAAAYLLTQVEDLRAELAALKRDEGAR